MYISSANSRAVGFKKWSDAQQRPNNDDDNNSGGATPIALVELPPKSVDASRGVHRRVG